jgi:hypothetical protein
MLAFLILHATVQQPSTASVLTETTQAHIRQVANNDKEAHEKYVEVLQVLQHRQQHPSSSSSDISAWSPEEEDARVKLAGMLQLREAWGFARFKQTFEDLHELKVLLKTPYMLKILVQILPFRCMYTANCYNLLCLYTLVQSMKMYHTTHTLFSINKLYSCVFSRHPQLQCYHMGER